MANAAPNRALAQKALQQVEAAVKAAEAALEGDPAPAPAVTPAVPVKAAQAVHQKPAKPKRSLRQSADSSNLRSDVATKVAAALAVVSQYVNASKAGTSAEVATQKFNELVAAINSGV